MTMGGDHELTWPIPADPYSRGSKIATAVVRSILSAYVLPLNQMRLIDSVFKV